MSAFETAAEEVKSLPKTPSNDEKLKLYALYKIGNGEDFAAAKQPGILDLTGKAKYAAWKAEAQKGTTKEAAQEEYVKLVEELKTKYA